MAGKKPAAAPFDVTCPCCQAVLTVDSDVRAIVAHRIPEKKGPLSTLDKAMEALRGADQRRDAAFREAALAERNKGDVLARKFGEGLKRAKDSPDPPIRPIDLD
ncbi:MAG: hypothetical protein DMD79_10640 [Candidatus Rokuibacteriota bacterium]|jgi:hypothetical protein|nr:MAG: hypothetical protein DMD79_10640 [Candidatus Rokubacteria bacterium]